VTDGSVEPASTFDYAARDRGGALVTGSLAADSITAVVTRLKDMGYAPIAITETGSGPAARRRGLPGLWQRSVPPAELALCCRHLGSLLDAGLPLLRALSAVRRQTAHPLLAQALAEVGAAVSAGAPLAGALARHPRVFPPLLVTAVTAGEAGGMVDLVLLAFADMLAADARLQAQTTAVVRDPCRLAVLAALVFGGVVVFAVRPLTQTLRAVGSPPPPLTVVLLTAGAVATLMGLVLLVLALLIAGGAALRGNRGAPDSKARAALESATLRLPGIGGLLRTVAVARFARTLGCLRHCGVPLLHSLQVAAAAADTMAVRRAVQAMRDSALRGQPLGAALGDHPVVPAVPAALLMQRTEEGLDAGLVAIGDLAELEVATRAATVRAAIEPALVLGLAVLVGWVAAVLYLPLTRAIELLR
jgi:type IV pilus assembly protein PilC